MGAHIPIGISVLHVIRFAKLGGSSIFGKYKKQNCFSAVPVPQRNQLYFISCGPFQCNMHTTRGVFQSALNVILGEQRMILLDLEYRLVSSESNLISCFDASKPRICSDAMFPLILWCNRNVQPAVAPTSLLNIADFIPSLPLCNSI